jgi:negative regulator of sigma-B (phosphoserine phosphatase)
MSVVAAHLSTPKPGEVVNGDGVVIRVEAHAALLAVVDGLGHGPLAARASEAALQRLTTIDLERPLLEIMRALHEDLRATRGAAATVCVLRGVRVEACAVGNVQLSSAGCALPLVLSPGVLGHQVGTFRVCKGEFAARARIALYSDGISTRVRWDDVAKLPPMAACEKIFGQYRRAEDDATILVADVEA